MYVSVFVLYYGYNSRLATHTLCTHPNQVQPMDTTSLKDFVLNANAFYSRCEGALADQARDEITWDTLAQLEREFQGLVQTFNANRAPLRMSPPEDTTVL